jgi:uncharacterized protein (TIGR00106 family)
MLMVEFAVNPLDQGESIGTFASEAIDFIARSGLKYKVGPMGTAVEGELGEVMAVVAECLTHLSQKSGRIVFSLQGDLKSQATQSQIRHSLERVEELLGEEVVQAESRGT